MDPEQVAFLAERPQWLHRQYWSNPYRYINSLLLRTVASMAQQLQLPAGARVLDFGCGDSPYRDCFPQSVDYVGADLSGNPKARVAVDAEWRVPMGDGEADAVISTQVLEHVSYPDRYLAECHRVLKPGGRLLLTTHGIMIYHRDPVDFWRWTNEGLQRIVGQAGFRIERFEGLMGLSATAIQLFQDATASHVPKLLRKPYVGALQSLAGGFDRLHSPASRARNALVFATLAAKPR